jgi:hypothetical protein
VEEAEDHQLRVDANYRREVLPPWGRDRERSELTPELAAGVDHYEGDVAHKRLSHARRQQTP